MMIRSVRQTNPIEKEKETVEDISEKKLTKEVHLRQED